MSDISLRLPYLIYLSIASLLLGVALAPLFRELPTPTPALQASGHAMQAGILDVPAVGAPQIAIEVEQDPSDGWNITIMTENFRFTPELVNGANVDSTGHGHLYVNGLQIARLYGPHYHIADLPEGDHEISVTLSSNDHSLYSVNGNRIEARTTVTQTARAMAMQ